MKRNSKLLPDKGTIMKRKHPNIVFILADDMGYGDVRYLNENCAFPTPNLDRLGSEGMVFTDAHSSSAVCTPSRYSILTGRYCWRTYLKQHVLYGVGVPLIEPERPTVATLLKNAGYRTACVGKWHVGWDWACKPGMKPPQGLKDAWKLNSGFTWTTKEDWEKNGSWIDFTSPVKNGPCTVGFDHFYGICGSLDMPPYVYVEDDTPVEVPTAWADPKEFCRTGPRMESMRANNVLGHLTDKAVSYIEQQKDDQPFFLYFPLTAPHAPIAPAPDFVGKSGINAYCDFCMEVDYRVGQILTALESAGLDENTMVVFTTDNGASANWCDCEMLEERYNHFCSHIYRGYKSDIWDGGHRLPFMVHWPEAVKPGSSCERMTGLFDFFATAADATSQEITDSAGEDSVSFLPDLLGQGPALDPREALVHHSISGMFAVRTNKWKLCRCPGSGGWAYGDLTDDAARAQGLPELQLYDMDNDPEEQHNLADEKPEVVHELTQKLHRIMTQGRSTPGKPQANDDDTPIEAWEQVNWLPEIPAEFKLND